MTDVQIRATITISQDDLLAAVMASSDPMLTKERIAQAIVPDVRDSVGKTEAERIAQAEAELSPRTGKPKRKYTKKANGAAVQPPPIAMKTDDVRLKVNPEDTRENQIKSVIIQSAMHKYGDAIGRAIMKGWDNHSDETVQFYDNLFHPSLETIAKAVIDTSEAELSLAPRIFVSVVFQRANALKSVAEPVVVPKGPAPCGVCEQSGSHAPGCPVGIGERRNLGESDGGAMPSRVPNPAIPDPKAAPDYEVCALGGTGGGCPFPQHSPILQGGAHIYVHPGETVRAIRAAMAVVTPQANFSAPPPPKARKPRAKKK